MNRIERFDGWVMSHDANFEGCEEVGILKARLVVTAAEREGVGRFITGNSIGCSASSLQDFVNYSWR